MARERWDKRTAFIMAAIGSAIGLGNVWRFPYMAYANGGGAFFIPYIIALITTGIPLISLEFYLGNRYQKGPTEAYGFIRKNTNYIGWFAIGTTMIIAFYYAVIMSWAGNYIFHSIGVRWSGNESNFFFSQVLGRSKGIGTLGGVQWQLVLCNLIIWLVIFLIIFKGIKVVGKVVNWTVGLPWVLLLILIIRGVTLKGAFQGLEFYLKPDFSQLLNPNVWLAAYGQIFFTLSLGFGVMIAYASYLPKRADINTNAWVVSFANCATSFFAGFAVFSVLGFLAFQTNQPISEVVDAGPGLAFIVYPTAIGTLPGGIIIQSIFGIMFFLMLFTLGIDSAFSFVEAFVTGLKDSFKIKREKASFWVCFVGFLIGMLFTSKAGYYWLDIIDHWMNWGLVIVGLLEAVLIGWFFDIRKVANDIDSTSQMKFGKIWIISVKYITPIILLITIVTSIVKEVKHPYEGYPIWSLMLGGWFLLISLMYFAIIMQNKDNFSTMKNRPLRFVGWLISYAGFIWTFYQFYSYSNKLAPCITLVLSVIIAFFTFSYSKNNKESEIKPCVKSSTKP